MLAAASLLLSCEKDEGVNPNRDLIGQMEAVTDSLVANANIPGIVALVVDHKKGIDWLYTAGYANIATQAPMSGSHLFRIGSNTKTMVGTVLLQLVDEGLLSLEDKLSDFFPEYPRADEVTIAMLCNMTSGIFNYTDDEAWGNEINGTPDRQWRPQELIEVGFSHDYYFDPGTDWTYSNTNTIIVGLIIEQLTGNTLQEEIDNRIVKPLQLTHTAFLTNGTQFPDPHATGYAWDDGAYMDVTEMGDISWGWAAGSAYSTPRELQKYVETLVEGGFLSNNLQNRRFTELHSVNAQAAYGYYIMKRGSFFGHNGGLPGYTSSMYHSKEKNCTVIIYFNCYAETHPDYLFFRFMNIL
ncbi:MAG: serine hydrolase domain-containing protein, partial [Bacteroidales bacterium]